MAPPAVAEFPNDTKPVVAASVMKLANELTVLPEKFVKAVGERPVTAHNDYCKEIPVISLKGIDNESERARIVAEVGRACADWGIFQIVDHGMSAVLMKRTMETVLEFFKLPVEEKLKCAAKPGDFPVGYASGSHRASDDVLDWREFMAHRSLPKAIRENDISTWPDKPEHYRKTLVEYCDACDGLVTALLGLISESLGLPTNYIKNFVGGDDADQKMILNYYPQCPMPDLTLGLRSHTDYGTITVLQQDQVGGLQVYNADRRKWVTVEPIPGALVVNLADQLQILSNNKYCSVMHQAIVNSNHTRLSIATLSNPNAMSQMGPAPELLSAENPAKYRTYKFKEYLPICIAKKATNHCDAVAL